MVFNTLNNETLQLVAVVKSIILWLRCSITLLSSNNSYLHLALGGRNSCRTKD